MSGCIRSARIEVRDSYFYGTKNAATLSYGVESFMVSDALVVNNIFQHVSRPIMMGPAAGGVYAYNFMIDMHYTSPATWLNGGINGSHDSGTGMNLFEGNAGNEFPHGPVPRNRRAPDALPQPAHGTGTEQDPEHVGHQHLGFQSVSRTSSAMSLARRATTRGTKTLEGPLARPARLTGLSFCWAIPASTRARRSGTTFSS